MQVKPKSLCTTLLSMHNQFAQYIGTGQLSPGRGINLNVWLLHQHSQTHAVHKYGNIPIEYIHVYCCHRIFDA